MNKNCILIDIDGTLADTEHRLHFIKEKDYNSFYEYCDQDEVIPQAAAFLEYLKLDSLTWIFVTGRPERVFQKTAKWLVDNSLCKNSITLYDRKNILDNMVVMRKNRDFRQDYIIKEEFLKTLQKAGYNVVFALEDRDQVVSMYRRHNVLCLQCADGSY